MNQAAVGTSSVSSCPLLPPSIRDLQRPGGMALRTDELKDPGRQVGKCYPILPRRFIIPPCDF